MLVADKEVYDSEKRRKLYQQIRRLQLLKESALSRLIDILAEIQGINENRRPDEIKPCIDRDQVANIFSYTDFSDAIEILISTHKITFPKNMPSKRGEVTIDYLIAAVLSYVIRDGRGARWRDIQSLLQWFNKRNLIHDAQWLHPNKYDRFMLVDQAKYHIKTYKIYVEDKRKRYFSPEHRTIHNKP